MREPIENEYFNWLCAKVLPVEAHVHIYRDLLKILHQTEYTWCVMMDENRAEDGVELRTYFLAESDWEGDSRWLNEPCSVLEMLIAFAMRANFQTDIPTRDWFWQFMENLGLDEYRRVSRQDIPVIEEILHTFTKRTYDRFGDGGLFPLRHPKHDQTEVDVWYQFCEYLEERGLI